MVDRVTPHVRSRIMSKIRSKGTKPEMAVRRMTHALGYRYRLHRRDLAGTPDLVFPGRHKIVFVHGCFWHGHDCKTGRRTITSNQSYWKPKLARNIERDARHIEALRAQGWDVLVVWECETVSDGLRDRLVAFLGPAMPSEFSPPT
jgi:DNA mismatch endonuclease (patch repair protein)